MEHAHLELLLRNNHLADRCFTWVASSESDDTYRYAVYLRAHGFTTALHPATSPAAFALGHLYMQEHNCRSTCSDTWTHNQLP